MRAFSYNGDMDREAPQPDTVAALAVVGRASSDDLPVMLGKVLRAISDALASIKDRQDGSLVARRLISIVLFFIRAVLYLLRATPAVPRPSTRGMAAFDRGLVAPPARWAAP